MDILKKAPPTACSHCTDQMVRLHCSVCQQALLSVSWNDQFLSWQGVLRSFMDDMICCPTAKKEITELERGAQGL